MARGDVQMLNLSADWLSIFLPHVLQKINRLSAAHVLEKATNSASVATHRLPRAAHLQELPMVL